MKPSKFLLILSVVLILASCGKKDVQSACFSNADHETMSDGRITRICLCVARNISDLKLTEKETSWVIDALEGDLTKDLSTKEKERMIEVKKLLHGIKGSCAAIK